MIVPAKKVVYDLVDKAIAKHQHLFDRRFKPGELINELPIEKRKVLEQLKSSDLEDVRHPFCS